MRRRMTPRRGATLVEAAIVMLVFFVLVFSMLDLGLGVLRYNMASEAACMGVRRAIVHGSLAPSGYNGGPWGPAVIDSKADASGVPLVDEIRPFLIGFDHANTTIKAEWLNDSNDIEQPVRVTVSTTYRPMLTLLLRPIPITASATMPIAH